MPSRLHFVTQSFGPAFESELRCRVVSQARECHAPRDGRKHDNVAEALPAKLRQKGAGDGGGAEKVGIELLA